MFLQLRNIFAGYDGSDVLKGIDIDIEQGTMTWHLVEGVFWHGFAIYFALCLHSQQLHS